MGGRGEGWRFSFEVVKGCQRTMTSSPKANESVCTGGCLEKDGLPPSGFQL